LRILVGISPSAGRQNCLFRFISLSNRIGQLLSGEQPRPYRRCDDRRDKLGV
jgi:hypothetical protein